MERPGCGSVENIMKNKLNKLKIISRSEYLDKVPVRIHSTFEPQGGTWGWTKVLLIVSNHVGKNCAQSGFLCKKTRARPSIEFPG